MKTISTIIIVLAANLMFGQNSSKAHKSKHCILDYTENKWQITHNDTNEHQCSDLVIKSLPPMSQEITPVNLDIIYKGHYSIKKDRSLKISREYNVLIKDAVTGDYYNLNSQEAYPFSIKKASQQERFVLEIKRDKRKSQNHNQNQNQEMQTASVN